MANTKISALTAATTPLDGTEVLPIVQSGATKKVSVSDLTAARSVSMGSGTISSGNLTFSSTGQRIVGDFSNATLTNRLAFQTTTVNGNTLVCVLPNGTSVTAALQTRNNSDPTNSAVASLSINSTNASLTSSTNGTGTALPLHITVNGQNALVIDTSQNTQFNVGNLVQGTAAKGITTGGAFSLGLGTNGSTTQVTVDTSGNLSVTGSVTAGKFIPTSSTAPSVGLYLPASDTNGLRGTATYFSNTDYTYSRIGGQKTTVSTTATTITYATSDWGSLVFVNGLDGSGNFFADLLFVCTTAGATVMQSKAVSGAPAARTYSGTSGALLLAMASGTYTVYCTSINSL